MAEPTVFIIDDDEAVRDSIKELVSSVGLATETFRSAVEFLEVFDAARPGCLVLDVRMARMSGVALQAKLKAMGARIPVVFISGHRRLKLDAGRGGVDAKLSPDQVAVTAE